MDSDFSPLWALGLALLTLGLGVTGFFFVTTRASLMVAQRGGRRTDSHIYWLYRSPRLIRLLDRQFISSVILLFQYHRLARLVLAPLCASREGQRVLQVSCVFGNFTQRLVSCVHKLGHVTIFDIMHSEVCHAHRKLAVARGRCAFLQGDAAAMPFQAGSFDYVVSFFLFHELPAAMKRRVFLESLRVLKPGGVFVYGEFHQPDSPVVSALSGLYFWVFEPYACEMRRWNPTAELDTRLWRIQRQTVMGGYFQVVTVERLMHAHALQRVVGDLADMGERPARAIPASALNVPQEAETEPA
jgi:ubiquinone/menaquinone biosynthesis C-methylase UbiE